MAGAQVDCPTCGRSIWVPEIPSLKPKLRLKRQAFPAAWIASAPLTAYYFERFTPVTLLANLIVIPMAFLMVLAGCLTLALGSCVGLLGEFFNHAACALIQGYILLSELLVKVPGANMVVTRPAEWMMALYYAGVTALAAAAWARREATSIAPETVASR